MELVLDRPEDFGIGVLKRLGEEAGLARLGTPHITCRHRLNRSSR
jgi:hypothetical protein